MGRNSEVIEENREVKRQVHRVTVRIKGKNRNINKTAPDGDRVEILEWGEC